MPGPRRPRATLAALASWRDGNHGREEAEQNPDWYNHLVRRLYAKWYSEWMMIDTLVDRNARLVRFTVSETVETADMLAALDDALRQLEPGRPYDVLSDHRELVRAVTPEQIRVLMGALSVGGQALRGGRCGVVVNSDASYGMMRLMGVHAEAIGIKVGVFRKLEEAVAFIAEPPVTPSAAP